MSTTKKFMSAIAAIVLIMSVAMINFAFKSNSKDSSTKTPLASAWYKYTGTNVTSASSYTLMNPQPNSTNPIDSYCPGIGEICAIFAPTGTGSNPAPLSLDLQDEITDAKSTDSETTNVKLRSE